MSGSRSVTNFGDWQKQQDSEIGIRTDIFGETSAILYSNPINKQVVVVANIHGKIALEYQISKLKQNELWTLETTLDKNGVIPSQDKSEPDIANSWSSRCSADYFNKSPDNECSDIKLSHNRPSDDFQKLASAVKILAEFASFPPEMVDDILLEIQNSILNHRAQMEKVTKLLVDGDLQTINEIKKAYSIYSCGDSCDHAMAWIQILVKEGRYPEAITWCNTFSKAVEPKRIILHCLMQLKTAETVEKQLQLEEDKSTGLDEDEKILSYLEKMVKCSWEIAKATNKSEDISLALHCLDELSGESGFEHTYFDIKALDEVDILILRARTTRELREENERLKFENSRMAERLRQLESQHGSLGNFGVFPKAAEVEKTTVVSNVNSLN